RRTDAGHPDAGSVSSSVPGLADCSNEVPRPICLARSTRGVTSMRVLHALRSDGFAGVERHIATLAVAQAQAGHEVTVIGGDTAKMRSAFGSAQVVAVPGNTVAEVINQVRRNRSVDIVHAHMTAAELAASLASRSPIVATRHFARKRGTTPVG